MTSLLWLLAGFALGLSMWWLFAARAGRALELARQRPSPETAGPTEDRGRADDERAAGDSPADDLPTVEIPRPSTRDTRFAPLPSPVDSAEQLDQEIVTRVLADVRTPLESIASGIGRELADLATAVQGNAQLLCEVTGEPELLPSRCEHLWAGVSRLRLLTEKLLAFSNEERLQCEAIDLRRTLEEVRRDVETNYSNLINVQLATTSFLPPALAHGRSLHNAILFVVETLFEIEPRARSLSIAAYADMEESDDPTVTIEINLETEIHQPPARTPKSTLQLGYLAARRSLESQNANLTIQQIPGASATSFITLEACPDRDEVVEPSEVARLQDHEFGGVLVLESEPSIRDLIATEVERCGRKILTTVDGDSARTLLEATPERFELLILAVDAPHESGSDIARRALATSPTDVKILLLARVSNEIEADLSAHPRVSVFHKPFGAIELREEVERILEPARAP